MVTINKSLNRRDFLKLAGGGVAAGMAVLVVGNKLGWVFKNRAYAATATQTIDFTITDALKEMVTHNTGRLLDGTQVGPGNDARCYFWVYKAGGVNAVGDPYDYPPECPGPVIMASKGDTVGISVTNDLDEDHAFYIPGFAPGDPDLVNSGPIVPGTTWTGTIDLTNAKPGGYLYYDNLNAPVNRVMGLHGALMVMPVEADRKGTHRLTPYSNRDAQLPDGHGVEVLYDSFGGTHFPGLSWEEGDARQWELYDPAIDGPTPVVCATPFRQYIWLTHQASPKLFAEVGDHTAGLDYPAADFMNKFLRDTMPLNQSDTMQVNNSSTGINRSYTPSYFTINGQSGYFSHFSPYLTMMGRVGEPCVVHILSAGLWTHSMHLHANHFWVTAKNGVPNPNPIWVDVYRVDPLDRIDYTVPFMKPPDIGQPRGIGPVNLQEPVHQTNNGHPVWPPIEEFEMHMPPLNTKAKAADGVTDVELGQRMSPLCYPMHDHSEPSQTSQGGNYNCGLISGIYFTGDRRGVGAKTAADAYLPVGDIQDFPMDMDFHMAYSNSRGCVQTEQAAPPIGEHH